ncbi:Ribosomal protein S3 mitochondrial [Bienertia sinuspersici]
MIFALREEEKPPSRSFLSSVLPFFPRDGFRVYKNLFFKVARKQLLGQLRRKCWNLMGKDKVIKFIERFIYLGGIRELLKGIEMMIEIILNNRRIPYGTNTNTLIETVKIKYVYRSASTIAQDIYFLPKKKR